MDVRDCRTVRLPSSISRRFAERRPGSIGHITLRWKCAGARSAGKPHAACDVAGAGNGLTVRLVRHSHRKRGETDRPRLRSTAPALDPTAFANGYRSRDFVRAGRGGRAIARPGAWRLAGSAGTVEPEHVDHVGMVPADRRLIKFGARG